tara:strand:+ start:3033 stop:5051 length:2019 start_codon:yes stop_codon:yes gene_type:complete
MYSTITLTFNENLTIGKTVSFQVTDSISNTAQPILESYVSLRIAPLQAVVKPALPVLGASPARSFEISFGLDFNGSGIYTVTRTDNVVVIQSTVANLSFSNPASTGDVTFTIANFSGSVFQITESIFQQATDACNNVKLKVTTNIYADVITSPIGTTTRAGNVIYIDVPRSGGLNPSTINLSLATTPGQQVSRSLTVPSILAGGNIALTINTSPNGATIIASHFPNEELDLEYSLGDGTTQTPYQISNIFTSVVAGAYTVYVRDQFGCIVNKSFTVDAFGVDTPYFEISESNSIRWVGRTLNGIALDVRIDQNRFSYEEDVKRKYKHFEDFTISNIPETQFKTNYASPVVKVYEGTTLLETIAPVKKTNNLRLTDSRDALKFSDTNGKTGIYFTTGKRYNFDTGADLLNDYTLNGNLPEWGLKGNYVKISGAWFEIEDVLFDQTRQAEYLSINQNYAGVEVSIIVGTNYNRENYEVWEFYNSFTNYLGKTLDMELINTDLVFDTLVYRAESVKVYASLPDHHEIKYSNVSNTDVMYSTGISFLINARLDKVSDAPIGENENFSSDDVTLLERANIKQAKEFVFESVTRGQMIKLYRSLYHRKLFINETGYAISETPEVEGGLEESSLYDLTAVLVKTGEYYNATSFDFDDPTTVGLLEMPALISVGNGFIEI